MRHSLALLGILLLMCPAFSGCGSSEPTVIREPQDQAAVDREEAEAEEAAGQGEPDNYE